VSVRILHTTVMSDIIYCLAEADVCYVAERTRRHSSLVAIN